MVPAPPDSSSLEAPLRAYRAVEIDQWTAALTDHLRRLRVIIEHHERTAESATAQARTVTDAEGRITNAVQSAVDALAGEEHADEAIALVRTASEGALAALRELRAELASLYREVPTLAVEAGCPDLAIDAPVPTGGRAVSAYAGPVAESYVTQVQRVADDAGRRAVAAAKDAARRLGQLAPERERTQQEVAVPSWLLPAAGGSVVPAAALATVADVVAIARAATAATCRLAAHHLSCS